MSKKQSTKKKLKKKLVGTDGLGPLEVKKIRTALRLVWHRSYARKLVVLRCTGKDGYSYCELCTERTPKLKVDHIKPVGQVDSGFVKRLFCPSIQLMGMCKECHDAKTKQERKAKKVLDTAKYGF